MERAACFKIGLLVGFRDYRGQGISLLGANAHECVTVVIRPGGGWSPWHGLGFRRPLHQSSYSGSSTDEVCVEVAWFPDGVAMRDSKDPDGGRLSVSGDHFGRLLHGTKAGLLDRP